MALLKCKMCGGDLQILPGVTVTECEYCGTRQTVPKVDDEKKLTLFARAGRLRAACEFDKAAGIYEAIVADFPEEAEAYWGLVLCKYGIEYVDDPATGKKIPTCHRSSFESVMEDSDFEQAVENADAIARKVYREEAKTIETLRKGIIAVSANEQPYDIFICYKETAENGERTLDSVLAQDVYDALTEKGYRVFFSRISLEDKLGQEYEPYIFAALHSAKIMLAFGTDYDYYNAVWVKNEWGRFLKLMAKDKSKHLIPCYKGIDAYDLPKEFVKLQAQDLGKVGATQDLLRGIEKLLPKAEQVAVVSAPVVQEVVSAGGVSITNLLKRAQIALEDEKWSAANEFCEQVLNTDAENGYAYLYKFMAACRISSLGAIERNPALFCALQDATQRDVARIRQYANGELRQWLDKVDGIWNAELERRRQAAEAERLRLEMERRRIEEEKRRQAEEAARRKALYQQKLQDQKLLLQIQNRIAASKEQSTYAAACVPFTGKVQLANVPKKIAKKAAQWDDIIAVDMQFDDDLSALHKRNYAYWTRGKYDYHMERGIVEIAAGGFFLLGLREDRTVQVLYDWDTIGKTQITKWTNIVQINAYSGIVAGLKSDGTVVAAASNIKKYGIDESNVGGWKNVIAVSTAAQFILGLHTDGTVSFAGSSEYADELKKNIASWQDIVQISTTFYGVVGLKSDGTVIATGHNEVGQCNVSNWTNIIAVKAGRYCTIGVKADGTILVAGEIKHDKGQIAGTNLFEGLTPEQRQQLSQKLVFIRNNFLKY